MTITNSQSGTNIAEVASGIYRINTPLDAVPGGFSFNQYLVVDDEPLLFHTGLRQLFPLVSEAVATVMPVERLRYVAFSHVEADESGALNDWLAAAPRAVPVCGRIAAMTSVPDMANRAPRALADDEVLTLGARSVRWIDAPHVPHGWECGFMFEAHTRTMLCGDLFTQPGVGTVPLVETDILGPCEDFRRQMDYYAHGPNTRAVLERMASLAPETLACMHGSAWRGEGGALLRALADSLESDAREVAGGAAR
jgi:flavorubredoxin